MAKTVIDGEKPTQEKLYAYGAFAFLYLRSQHHRSVPLAVARMAIQPPIDLGFYKVFHADGVPRMAVTWAFFGDEAEEKFTSDQMLLPQDWCSGKKMWVVEIVAPYGKGTAAEVVRWLQSELPPSINRVRYQRVTGDHANRKYIEVNRLSASKWGARVLKPSEVCT